MHPCRFRAKMKLGKIDIGVRRNLGTLKQFLTSHFLTGSKILKFKRIYMSSLIPVTYPRFNRNVAALHANQTCP